MTYIPTYVHQYGFLTGLSKLNIPLKTKSITSHYNETYSMQSPLGPPKMITFSGWSDCAGLHTNIYIIITNALIKALLNEQIIAQERWLYGQVPLYLTYNSNYLYLYATWNLGDCGPCICFLLLSTNIKIMSTDWFPIIVRSLHQHLCYRPIMENPQRGSVH